MLYLLNSAVLTSFGVFEHRGPLSFAFVETWLQKSFVSAIGHQATADWIKTNFNKQVAVHRQEIQMRAGDQALVIRLTHRQAEGVVLPASEMPFEAMTCSLICCINNA